MVDYIAIRMCRPNGNMSWGFRLHGGVEYGMPLLISAVAGGSLASQAGVRVGDLLQSLAGIDCTDMTHNYATRIIQNSHNVLDMVVERQHGQSGAVPASQFVEYSYAPPSHEHAEHDGRQAFVSPQPPRNLPTYTTMTATAPHSHAHPQQQHMPPPPAPSAQQYNSPAALYAKANSVDEYLNRHGGIFGTDPNLFRPAAGLKVSSSLLAAVEEDDRRRPRHTRNWSPERARAEQSASFNRIAHAMRHDQA